MKTRTLILIIVFLLIASVLIAGGSKKKELYGTWINQEYDALPLRSAKFVFDPDPDTFGEYNQYKETLLEQIGKPDGSYAQYRAISDTEPKLTATFKITDMWSDSEGNIFYKIHYFEYLYDGAAYALIKISGSGSVFERNAYVFGINPIKKEINPHGDYYSILYRQE